MTFGNFVGVAFPSNLKVESVSPFYSEKGFSDWAQTKKSQAFKGIPVMNP